MKKRKCIMTGEDVLIEEKSMFNDEYSPRIYYLYIGID
jgi:hypothetical protein